MTAGSATSQVSFQESKHVNPKTNATSYEKVNIGLTQKLQAKQPYLLNIPHTPERKYYNPVRFEVLTVVLLRTQVLWDVTLCSWASGVSYFKEMWYLQNANSHSPCDTMPHLRQPEPSIGN